MDSDLTAEAIAARWADVTGLEMTYAVLRDQFGTEPATRALIGILKTKGATWTAERLAAAVAALDDVRRDGALPPPTDVAR
ncbi:hypothetical protein [Amycolatopsis sp. NPDC059021]|uniref:hypothetical protein n=1 Tax=Amycolatopsis sp. NPDC059021 TaxID=3346704 RepID=UPI00366B86A9